MSVARVVEITATSERSFEDAMRQGVARATQTLRNVRSAWIKEQQIRIDDGKIIEHWEVLQPVPETTASGNDMFSRLS